MSYSTRITEQRRSLIVFLIDQSGSMSESYSGEDFGGAYCASKAHVVAQSANLMLMDIIARCRQGESYKHYFDIGVLGYSGKGVYSLLPNNRSLMSPSELAANVVSHDRILRRARTLQGAPLDHYNNLKVWIHPYAEGDTPLCAAFSKVSEVLHTWRNAQKTQDNFPPTIINITDGEMTDGTQSELLRVRKGISRQGTEDGEPLLFNIHISNNYGDKILFPTDKVGLSRDAEVLYDISSELPSLYNDAIATIKGCTEVSDKVFRAFSYNLPLVDFMNAIQIGTATTQQIHR